MGTRNVEGSGWATRSLSFTSLNPAMLEPSKPIPRVRANFISYSGMSWALGLPSRSTTMSLMYLMSHFLSRLSMGSKASSWVSLKSTIMTQPKTLLIY